MAEKQETPAEEKGGNYKLFVINGVVLVLLICAAAGTFFFLTKNTTSPDVRIVETGVPVSPLNQQNEIGPMVNIDEFIVNIISADSTRYVKAALTFELTNDAVSKEVQKRMPQVRDAILLLIGNKTFEELQDLQGKRQLKAELKSRINSFLQTGKVKSIYFTNFVVQ
jgi:flagellar FliL protein